ncbi:hypothetical protein ETAA8_29420 [Anatilimnocola aggregata]|uniref:Putative zinc-finger domain-containing protein n=1 Tax=Anatilimnocola aggregata TaxID=2528021 RepID=A0A517YCA9_9BACT|nr:zf-HC2 domain-containing protein [Anatilimnocola aggregata]QDU27851.1 hypothetical protein ETAA8_29420 [Anatilimnocola aggregata]
MKCTDFEDRLNQLLDDRLPVQDDQELAAHADQCADCREVLTAQEHLFRGLRTLQRQTMAPDLGRLVLAEVVTQPISFPPIPPPRFQRPWAAILTSAAALLVAVSLGTWIANRSNPAIPATGTNETSSRPLRPDGLAIIKAGPKRLQATPHGLALNPAPSGDSSVPLDQRAAYRQAMESLSTHWPHSSAWTQPSTWPVENLDVEHYAPSIRPIRESFEVAIDVLMRTLPGKRDVRSSPPQALQPYGGWRDVA